MMRTRRIETPTRLRIAALGCILAAVVGILSHGLTARAADTYTFSTFDVPGSNLTVASSIDIAGRIVGYYTDNSGTHGFVFNSGAYSAIDVPGARWTVAYGINNAGQIVGGFGTSASAMG